FMVNTNVDPVLRANRPLNIPIYTNGSLVSSNLPLPGPLYSGRLHQILQLAANIHDATTGAKGRENKAQPYPYLPSVFRPRFEQRGNDVYITDYKLVTESASFW